MIHDYAQKEDGWCGPAALSYALSKQGKDIRQEVLVKKTGTTVSEGVDQSPLVKAVKDAGMETIVTQGRDAKETLDLLDSYVRNGWSVVLDYLQGDHMDDGHYVVLENVHKDSLEVFDPSNGGSMRTMEKKYFIDHWKDVGGDGKTLRHWALVFSRKGSYAD